MIAYINQRIGIILTFTVSMIGYLYVRSGKVHNSTIEVIKGIHISFCPHLVHIQESKKHGAEFNS